MKPIQIAQRSDFTAYLINGAKVPKLAIVFKDNSKAPVTLGPDDYVPGYEPTRGTKACELTWLFDREKKEMKPEVIALAEKFSQSGELFTKGEARTKYNLDSALEGHLGQLNEICNVLDLIENSDAINSATSEFPEYTDQLRAAFHLVAKEIKENARKAYEIYTKNHFDITGKPVVPDCVKEDFIFRNE